VKWDIGEKEWEGEVEKERSLREEYIVSRARLESLPHDTKGGGRAMSTLL